MNEDRGRDVFAIEKDGRPGRMMLIDDAYVRCWAHRALWAVPILLLIVGNLSIWIGFRSGEIRPLSAWTVTGMNIVFAGTGGGVAWLLLIFARGSFVAIDSSKFTYNVGAHLLSLDFSSNNRLVVEKSSSGRAWRLSTSARPRRKLRIPVAAFPVLHDFVRLALEDLGVPDSLEIRCGRPQGTE